MSKPTLRVDRRRFLEISGGATAALVSACSDNMEPADRPATGAGGSGGGLATGGSTSSSSTGNAQGGGTPTGTGGAGGHAPDSGAPDGSRRDAASDAADAKVQEAGPPPPLTEADWTALANSLSGTVIRPGNMLYNQARVVFNTRFDSIMPQAVVRAANPSDVAKVLAFVQKFQLAVTPRCGGHDFAGYSTTTGVVIDVGPMS